MIAYGPTGETRRVCILSLRCAPGLQKEIDSLCAGFQRNGWAATQILAEDYSGFRPKSPEVTFVPLRRGYAGMLRDAWAELSRKKLQKSLTRIQPDLVLFYNQSPLNLLLMRIREQIPACRFGVFLHDPWKARKFSYGPAYAFTYAAVEKLQTRTAQQCDFVLTLSNWGTELVRTHYRAVAGACVEGRILLPDRPEPAAGARSVVSIIGRINPSTGHDEFFSLVSGIRGQCSGLSFEVVTSSAAAGEPGFAARAAAAGVAINYQPILSENQIEAAVARSLCVFRMDDELTQSGVVPVCYRAGTPVVARDIPGLRQHVEQGRTGYILGPETSPATLAGWLEDMRVNQVRYQADCRAAFLAHWDDNCFERYYGALLQA